MVSFKMVKHLFKEQVLDLQEANRFDWVWIIIFS